MKTKRIVLFLSLFFIALQCTFAQVENSSQQFYSLDYDQLFSKFVEASSIDQDKIVTIYLERAKNEKNEKEIAQAYRMKAFQLQGNQEIAIKYFDSALINTGGIDDKSFVAVLHLGKGFLQEQIGIYDGATGSYLRAIQYSRIANDKNLEYYATHNLGVLKSQVGDVKEAQTLFFKCLKYENEKNYLTYEDSLSIAITENEIINTYRLLEEKQNIQEFNEKSFLKYKSLDLYHIYTLNKGIGGFVEGKIRNSIPYLEFAVKELEVTTDLAPYDRRYYLVIGKLYLGRAYKETDSPWKATQQFRDIDTLSSRTNYYSKEVKDALYELITISRENSEKKNELDYINKFLKVDSINDTKNRQIGKKIENDFDKPQLLRAKETIIASLENKYSISKNIIVLFVCLIVLLVFLFYRVITIRKKRFENAYAALEKKYEISSSSLPAIVTDESEISGSESKAMDISREIVQKILKKLNEFEDNNEYLKKNISVGKLASSFETNTKYLSKVINYHKEKNFSTYINDLRIDHFIKSIKTDSKVRNYTIKALASESGFSSAEVFAKTFKKSTGIYPSFFIKKEIEKNTIN